MVEDEIRHQAEQENIGSLTKRSHVAPKTVLPAISEGGGGERVCMS